VRAPKADRESPALAGAQLLARLRNGSVFVEARVSEREHARHVGGCAALVDEQGKRSPLGPC
jgi:hypothetical protein